MTEAELVARLEGLDYRERLAAGFDLVAGSRVLTRRAENPGTFPSVAALDAEIRRQLAA